MRDYGPLGLRKHFYSDDEILAAIRRHAAEHGGQPPSTVDWQYAGETHPNAVTVRRAWHGRGGFKGAVRDAGFEPVKGGRPPSSATRPRRALRPRSSSRGLPVSAADVVMRPVRWAWRDLIPEGMLTVIGGVPGASKSLLGVSIAGEVSRRRPVLLSAAEDALEEIVVPRLRAVGAVMENVQLWRPQQAEGPVTAELEWLADEYELGMIVLDPLTAHVPASRESLLPLGMIAHNFGCAIVGLHHTTKSGTTALERLAGPTGGAAGTARAVYVFGANPENVQERVLAPVKVNVRDEPRSVAFERRLRRVRGEGYDATIAYLELVDDSSPVTADEVIRGVSFRGEDGMIAGAAEWLTGYLRMGPRPIVEVLEDAQRKGIPARSVKAAADAVGTVSEDGDRWRLPMRHPWATS